MTIQSWMVLKEDYQISFDQDGLKPNQIRLYINIDETTRKYVVITIDEE